MRLPLLGRRVALYRSADQAEGLASAIQGLGGEPISVPLVAVAAPNDGGAALDRLLRNLDDYDWLVFTSSNGVRAVLERDPDALARHPEVAVVGGATAMAVDAGGGTVRFLPTIATASTLASELASRGSCRVAAPLAELAGPDLADGLRARGFTIDRVEAYRLVDVDPAPELLKLALDADAAVFTSPSIVDRYVSLQPSRRPRHLISIGPRTTVRLTEVGLRPTSEADPHDASGIVAALVAALAGASSS